MTPILAATFTIALEGLMVLQGEPSGAKHIAIVAAYEHDHPKIMICGSQRGGGCDEIPLKAGDRVEFLNYPKGNITTDESYRDHVPHLADYVVKGHIHDDIVDETSNDGVLAFVDLPAGDMTTYRTFIERVRLTKKSGFFKTRKFCFARFVVLTPTSSALASAVLINGKNKGDIEDGAVVVISNASNDRDRHEHFPYYANVLNKGGKVGDAEILDETCNAEADTHNLSPNAVKILNDLYKRAPHGDCGPTGNP